MHKYHVECVDFVNKVDVITTMLLYTFLSRSYYMNA